MEDLGRVGDRRDGRRRGARGGPPAAPDDDRRTGRDAGPAAPARAPAGRPGRGRGAAGARPRRGRPAGRARRRPRPPARAGPTRCAGRSSTPAPARPGRRVSLTARRASPLALVAAAGRPAAAAARARRGAGRAVRREGRLGLGRARAGGGDAPHVRRVPARAVPVRRHDRRQLLPAATASRPRPTSPAPSGASSRSACTWHAAWGNHDVGRPGHRGVARLAAPLLRGDGGPGAPAGAGRQRPRRPRPAARSSAASSRRPASRCGSSPSTSRSAPPGSTRRRRVALRLWEPLLPPRAGHPGPPGPQPRVRALPDRRAHLRHHRRRAAPPLPVRPPRRGPARCLPAHHFLLVTATRTRVVGAGRHAPRDDARPGRAGRPPAGARAGVRLGLGAAGAGAPPGDRRGPRRGDPHGELAHRGDHLAALRLRAAAAAGPPGRGRSRAPARGCRRG